MPRSSATATAGVRPLSLLWLTIPTLVLAGCGGGSADTRSETPQATAPQVTRPYDVRQGDDRPASPYTDAPGFQLTTATEPVHDASSTPHAGRLGIEKYEDWSLSETAARALGRMGNAAVPELSRSLSDPNPVMRRRAADILAQIGPDAKDAVPALTRALDDPDEEVRKSATRALGEIGPAAKEAVPYLIEALREPGRIPEASP